MYNLYYNHSRKTMRLGQFAPPKNIKTTVFATGELRFRRSLAQGHYIIDVGDFKDALFFLPTVTSNNLNIRVWSPALDALPLSEYTQPMRAALKSVLYSDELRNLIWDFVGIGEAEQFENAVTIRTIPVEAPYNDGGAPWRLCEATMQQNRTFMLACDARRSMYNITRLALTRDGANVSTIFPERHDTKSAS